MLTGTWRAEGSRDSLKPYFRGARLHRNKPSNISLLSFVSASILGLVSLALLALSSSASADGFILRKPLIGAVFVLVCVLGALAVVLPKKCNSLLSAQEGGSFGFHFSSSSTRSLRGHHFDCADYVSHTFNIGGRTLCAACSGLLLGAAVSILCSVAFFFFGVELGQFRLAFLTIGMLLVALGFVQFKFPGVVRLLVNTLFVFGAFQVLLAMDALLENLFIDFYVTSLILLWIMTRILLSQWDHSRICHSCTVDCELKK